MKGYIDRSHKRHRKLKIVNKKRFYTALTAFITLGILSVSGISNAINAKNANHEIVEEIEFAEEELEIETPKVEEIPEVVEEAVIEEPIQDVTIYTTNTRVNIRNNPDINSKRLDTIEEGKRVDIQGKYNNEWYMIDYYGETAYIYAKYVDEKNIQLYKATKEIILKSGFNYEPEIFDYIVELTTSTNTNLRTGPSKSSKVYTTVYPGTHLQVIGEDGEWYITKFFNDIVYVHYSTSTINVGRKPKGDIKKIGLVTNQTIAFKDATYQNDSFFLADGEFVEIYGEYGDFYLVRTTDGVGYIPASSVKTGYKIDNVLTIVDESSNVLTAYAQKSDGTYELLVEAPTITGRAGHETPIGLTKVIAKYNPSDHHQLKGKDENGEYCVDVDYCIKVEGESQREKRDFNGINLHNSSNQYYGGNKKLSHGCVRLPYDISRQMVEIVERGDYVYFKR